MISTLEHIQQRWLPELERRITESGAADGLVGTMCSYHLGTGGKRFRALLPVWVCDSLGGDPESALDLGAGLELLHNATLVHDDIQDGDAYRRGRPTVWRRWGAPQAINAGDALVFRAMERIALSPVGARVVPLVCGAMIRLIEGQAMDLQLHLPESDPERLAPSPATWMEMARRKTGALFSACFQAGALAAGAEAAVVASGAEYGEFIGMLFQVQDDLLDIVGDKGRRARGGDLVGGKMSFPVLWALEHMSAPDAATLRGVVNQPREETTPDRIEIAIGLLEGSGALSATMDWLLAALDKALRCPMAALVPGLAERIVASVTDLGVHPRADSDEPGHLTRSAAAL